MHNEGRRLLIEVCRPCRQHFLQRRQARTPTLRALRSTIESWCVMRVSDQYNPGWTSMSRNSGRVDALWRPRHRPQRVGGTGCGGRGRTSPRTSIGRSGGENNQMLKLGRDSNAPDAEPFPAWNALSPGVEAAPGFVRVAGEPAVTIAVWVEVRQPVIHIEGGRGSRGRTGGALRKLAPGSARFRTSAAIRAQAASVLSRHGDDEPDDSVGFNGDAVRYHHLAGDRLLL